MTLRIITLGLASLICACGSADSGSGGVDANANRADADPNQPDGTTSNARYFPLAIGNSWTYQVTHLGGGASGVKTQTVETLETLTGPKAGVQAFRLRSQKPSGEFTLSWQEDIGQAVVRHLEDSYDSNAVRVTAEMYDPSKLRLDESAAHIAMGASYDTTYTEMVTDVAANSTSSLVKTETWAVEAPHDSVTVPAGTFDCVRVRRSTAPTGVVKTYWYARGVGKVKEDGSGQIEELTAFDVVP